MNTYDDSNIFAKILNGDIPCDKVYEDDHVLAFRDIDPKAPVHILVIPKGAYTSIHDFGANASADESLALHSAIYTIADDEGLAANGYRVIANTGDHGGQEVPHFHYHILGGQTLGPMLA